MPENSAREIHVEKTIGRDSEKKASEELLTQEVQQDLLTPMVDGKEPEKENLTFLYDINVSDNKGKKQKEEIPLLKNGKELKQFVMRYKSTVIKTDQIVRRFQDWLETEYKETHNIDTLEPERLDNYTWLISY